MPFGAQAREPVPLSGRISRWEEARGFGFVTPDDGGPAVFLHIRAVMPGQGAPQVGDRVDFLKLEGPQGPFAKQVRLQRTAAAPRRENRPAPSREPLPSRRGRPARRPRETRKDPRAPVGLLLITTVLAYAAATWFWRVPFWVGLAYVGMSLIALLVYADDKDAAQRGRWRTSEQTLLTIGLLGGWPGALVAQRLLRHKTRKATFQGPFWASVLVNIGLFVAFFGPIGLKSAVLQP